MKIKWHCLYCNTSDTSILFFSCSTSMHFFMRSSAEVNDMLASSIYLTCAKEKQYCIKYVIFLGKIGKILINMLGAVPVEIKYACYSGLFSSRQLKNKYLRVISKFQLQYKVSLHL